MTDHPARRPQAAPIEAAERASIARLLEAARDALQDSRLHLLELRDLADHLVGAFDRASLDVRRGWREAALDAITAELDRYREQLADAAERPDHNPADPFTVETPHRPITNSGP